MHMSSTQTIIIKKIDNCVSYFNNNNFYGYD